MPRKGENIRKRKDGRWEARYEKCRDQNGRIQYGYLYGRTYEAVKKKKLAVLCQNNLQNSPGKCYVFRNLSEEWMLSMRYAVKLSTYACYETLLDTHILPEFGDMPLKYISSASVYSFSEKLKQQGLSPRTIKNLLILFHSILRYGEKQGYLNLSQLEFRYPKINTSPFQLISHEHLIKLITVLSAEDSEFSIGILLCIYTGIRVGELSGIRWEDIDFDKREICIQRAKDSGTGQVFHDPKTKAGIRYIPIVYDACINRLKAMQTSGKITYINGFVFCTESGKALNYGNIRRAWLKICELAGVNKNIHTFRHTFATAALTKDIPILEVSRCLGHADANTTLKMYGHAMPGFNRHIIDLFQKKKSKSATRTATINQQS